LKSENIPGQKEKHCPMMQKKGAKVPAKNAKLIKHNQSN
jgi:hypothetical protein